MILLWNIIIVVNFVFFFVDCQFESQYLGHHYTLEEYNDLDLACDTRICLRDAQLLLLAATQNKTVQPCDDFLEFSMGRFIELGARNDRYTMVGFQNEVNLLDWERKRKVLAATVKNTDIRPFKIAKNYYQKCVSSDNVRINGTAEMLQYVKSFGGAKFFDSNWDEKNFNIEELFEKEPYDAVLFLLKHLILRCPHPQNKSQETVCLKSITHNFISLTKIDDIVEVFKNLKIDENMIRKTYQNGQSFSIDQSYLSGSDEEPRFFTIASFNKYTNEALNWLKIFNSQLTVESQLTEDSKVMIEKPDLLLKLLDLIKDTPKETIADYFAFIFSYYFKNLFIVYPFDEKRKITEGTNKSKQRWEQCVGHLYELFGPALQGLYAERYYKKEVQESVKTLTNEVVNDLIGKIIELDINNDAKFDVVERLNTAQYVIGYPEEVLDLQKFEEFYKDLELDGTEGIVQTFISMNNFHVKINNNPNSNWKRQLIKLNGPTIIYYIEENKIYIPQKYIHYPYYHANRPRFFNTATLFGNIAYYLKSGIKDYLLKEWTITTKSISSKILAYNNYVDWEESGGKDLQLPGFFLTNRQMYWVATAHSLYYKIHPHNTIDKKYRLKFQNFHKSFMELNQFREAFNCPKN